MYCAFNWIAEYWAVGWWELPAVIVTVVSMVTSGLTTHLVKLYIYTVHIHSQVLLSQTHIRLNL